MADPFKLRPVDGTEFLRFITRAGRSEEAGGVSSQYEDELRRGDQGRVRVTGVYACGRLVGAYSWGTYSCERTGGVSGRLDVVATDFHVRRSGVGGLLMGRFVTALGEEHTDKLEHISTVAVHPAVQRFYAKLGFDRLEKSSTPLYQIKLDASRRSDVLGRARILENQHRRQLKLRCLECQRQRWSPAWCRTKGEPKGTPEES